MGKSVIRRGAIMAAVFFLPMITVIPEAGAISWSKQMPDGKVCRVLLGEPHVHAANGAMPDKTAAQRKAIRDWSSFTVFEYGRSWGSWSHAIGHSMTCMNDTDAGVWRCRAEAQPCKSEQYDHVMRKPQVRGYIAREHGISQPDPRSTSCDSRLSCLMDLLPVDLDWLRR